MMKVAVIISPNWRHYAEKYLRDCLVSLVNQDYQGALKFYLIDNESSESSRSLVNGMCQTHLAGKAWMLLASKENDGFAKGNNIAIKQAMIDGFDAVLLINMDGVLEGHCISALVETMEEIENAGAVQARIMLWPDKQKINSLGNVTHFLGFGYCGSYREDYIEGQLKNGTEICYPSGAAVLLRARALEQVGLFDEDFWMYNEDQDLGWRLWQAGWPTVIAVEAVFYHKYQFSKSIKQFYWQDRNRILAMLKNYDSRTLALIAPAFLFSELGLWLTAFKGGWLKDRAKVYRDLLNRQTLKRIRQERSLIKNYKKVSDKQIIRLFSGRIMYQEVDSPLVRIGNIIFGAYWRLIKRIIYW